MPYVYPKYPGAIFNDTDYPDQTDKQDWIKAWLVNALKEELQAALTELGTNPKGEYDDVKARLEAIEDAAAISGTYDSGWFACTLQGTYTKTHNLGTTKLLVKLYFATSSGGANMSEVQKEYNTAGGSIQAITTTQLTVQAAISRVTKVYNSNGQYVAYSNGYYRVIAIALK